jgi:cytochrome P450
VDKALQELQKRTSGGGSTHKNVLLDKLFDQIALNTLVEASFTNTGVEKGALGHQFESLLSSMGISVGMVLWLLCPKFLRPAREDSGVAALRRMGTEMVNTIRGEKKKQCDDTVKTQKTPGIGPNAALIEHLVGKHQSGDMSESAVVDHVITFLFAGHDTTSKGLLWCAYLLAMHPEKQALLLEELSSAVSATTVPTLETVNDLPYLNAVIKETLRLYSPVGLIFRTAQEDDVLPYSKTFIPKGQVIVWHPYVTHRSQMTYGDDAVEFKPERWENRESSDSQCDWMPFLVGKRNCIGRDFAMNELLIVMATLVRRYDITLSEKVKNAKTGVEEKQNLQPRRINKITVRPKVPLEFDLTLRE